MHKTIIKIEEIHNYLYENLMLKPDLNLVEKYNQPGPRYTSYPTAPHFTEEVDHSELIRESASETGNLSLYFHIPFCKSLCWFCGCTKIITKKREPSIAYMETLKKEILQYLPNIKPGRKVQQLHFGGGTPNYLDPDLIDDFADFLQQHFTFTEDAELSAELDPRTMTEAHMKAFKRLGINRVSFGVQDVKIETQKAVNRVQSDEQNTDSISWAKEAGIDSLNIDLIYGLPHQTPESIRDTIQQVLKYSPDRLAVFSYAHVPWISPAQKILERNGLPSAEEKIQMLGVIIEELTSPAAGYQYIGMDHFAKVDDSLAVAQRNKTMQRNFQGYSTFSNLEICAFGMSSISQTSNSYRQNAKDLADYTEMVNLGKPPIVKGLILTDEDHIRRTTIMRLMCDLELNYEAMSDKLGIDFKIHFADALAGMDGFIADGLVELSDSALKVTPQGSLFVRNIAMNFDEHLVKGIAKHSKTV